LGRKQPSREETQETYTIGEYRFSPESAQLLHTPTREITLLPRREADILQFLCKGGGSIIPTQNILLSLWGDDDFFNARSLQVLITRLRRALSKDPRIRIVNVRGTGYKLIAE
jgi:DNA-binding response OmpR family regulator